MRTFEWVRRGALALTSLGLATMLASCGGGSTGKQRDSGIERTTLSVAASDPEGDALSYEWRVTAGTLENRNARQTVWSLPPGPGLHFAYVLISDGKGGYTQHQYAVGSDSLDLEPPNRAATTYPLALTSQPQTDGTAVRLRLRHPGPLHFGGSAAENERVVYLPDVAVRVVSANSVVHSATSDANGEINLPQLAPGTRYTIECATIQGGPFTNCAEDPLTEAPLTVRSDRASVQNVRVPLAATDNLRLHGHVSLADGSVCGIQDDYFKTYIAATVQLLNRDGQPLTPRRRVNVFGDYALTAPVAVDQPMTLRIECGSQVHDVALRPDTDAQVRQALMSGRPLERSHSFFNRRPQVVRMVAVGADGNVRGRAVIEERAAPSNSLPGRNRFLAYKGFDTALSACMYYRSIGAVETCDAQGSMKGAISFDDWKRRHRFSPYTNGNREVAATYINQRDLNLVRRMVATQTASDSIAFYVCNNPGPEGRSQAEIDQVIDFGVANERRVACVAMEWTSTPGVNDNQPFTKFLTFGPDGSLIPSVNLDGRGEKYMPGACVACHGGSRIGGRFPETGNPSPLLGARFLPFDTGNYLFSTRLNLTEEAQHAALRQLNELVVATEGSGETPTKRLVAGWYAHGGSALDKSYVPMGWRESSQKATFYREVIGTSCRTCHTALGNDFDWDDRPGRFDGLDRDVQRHVCGGTADLALNATMPNALASLNRLLVDHPPDSLLRQRMQTYLGCSTLADDPVHPRR